MPTARPNSPSGAKPTVPPSPKAGSPKPKAKKASPKPTGSKPSKAAAEAKVANLQEQVSALQSELELARMHMQEQGSPDDGAPLVPPQAGLLSRLISDHRELLLNLQQLTPVPAREGALHRISALRSFLASAEAVSAAAHSVLEDQLVSYEADLAEVGEGADAEAAEGEARSTQRSTPRSTPRSAPLSAER